MTQKDICFDIYISNKHLISNMLYTYELLELYKLAEYIYIQYIYLFCITISCIYIYRYNNMKKMTFRVEIYFWFTCWSKHSFLIDDTSRVKLSIHGSLFDDYINANYIAVRTHHSPPNSSSMPVRTPALVTLSTSSHGHTLCCQSAAEHMRPLVSPRPPPVWGKHCGLQFRVVLVTVHQQ